MGDVNQIIYLKRHIPNIDGPVVEIGSKDYGNTSSFRSTYLNNEYIGVDLSAGKGVDVVQDLTLGVGDLPESYFTLGICCSVLEHVRRPWIMAENISKLIRPEGQLYISVPWVWRFHAYPDDYFRFSYRGILELFPQFSWRACCYSTNVPEEIIPIDEGKGIDNQMAIHMQTPRGPRKYLPYLMVNMIGTKVAPKVVP